MSYPTASRLCGMSMPDLIAALIILFDALAIFAAAASLLFI